MTEILEEKHTIREIGKKALSCVIKKEKNVNALEKVVWKNLGVGGIIDEAEYSSVMYQIAFDITKGIKLTETVSGLNNKKFGWNHPSFDDANFLLRERDAFLVKPFEVEEGVVECRKCKSKKVYVYQKQTRSADEPMTTFAECACGYTFTYSG